MYKRQWVQKPVINSKHAENDSLYANDRSFTVATYNLLGDKMMEVGQYLHMRWDQQRTHYRHQLLVRDMEHLQSDILCLQEVEQENWNTYYYDELRRLGYEGIYHPRSDGLGLAVCYRCDKWHNKSHEGYTLHDLLNSAVIDMVQDTQDRKDLLDFIHKPSTVLYVSLTHIASREDVIVANIHTVWDDLRQPQLVALQACAAMEGYRKYFQKDGKSLIFLGDFNTPPSCPLYHMLSGGVVTKDLFQTPSSTEDQKLKNIGSKLFQLMPNMYTLNFNLESAYKTVLDMVQDTQDRKDLLDFIHKPSTVLYVSLTHIASREDVIVANIHTVWDDLRQPQLVALQACAAMEGYRKYFQKDGKSLIFLGDFNTPPSCPLYHMLSGGVVTKDLFQTPSSTEDQKLKNIGSKLFQLMPNMYTLNFNLESAYKTVLDMVQDTQDRKDLLDFIHKPSTVLYVSLTHIASREDVIVANIHTVWDDLRQPQLVALQACAAMEGYRKYFQKDGKSLIFLGDFNTPPSCPLYHMLSGGVVTKDLFQTPSSTEDQKLKNIGSKLFQLMPNMYTLNFNLESAYKTVLGKEPGITSADCAPSYTAYCLDYVWYTPHSLQVQGVLETPTEDLILDPHVFPVTEHFPSDHIPLLVKFGFLEIN